MPVLGAGTSTIVDKTVRVLVEDLDGGSLSGAGLGPVTNYDVDPGTGSGWSAAPDSGSEYTYTPPFRPATMHIFARSFSVEVRFAFDSVPTYGDWLILEPGAHHFVGWSPTVMQIREETDGAGAEYQIMSEA